MDECRVREAIDVLDAEVPRTGARVRLHQYGGCPDEGQIVANETGYLRLGVEFLKAAFAPPGQNREPAGIKVDIAYLLTSDSSINFDWFERRQVPIPERPFSTSRFVPIIVIGGLAAFALLALIGVITVVRWLAA